jgi:hypothetical protein
MQLFNRLNLKNPSRIHRVTINAGGIKYPLPSQNHHARAEDRQKSQESGPPT